MARSDSLDVIDAPGGGPGFGPPTDGSEAAPTGSGAGSSAGSAGTGRAASAGPDALAAEAGDLAVDLRLAVARLARRVRQAETGGLTPSQLSALAAVDQLGAARLTDIAAAEGVAAPTATRIVAALEQAGLVARRDDPDDRRASRVTITAAGRAALRRIRTNRTAFIRRRLVELDEADRAALRAALPLLVDLAGDER